MTIRDQRHYMVGAMAFATILNLSQVVGSIFREQWAWAGAFCLVGALTLYTAISIRRRIEEDAP